MLQSTYIADHFKLKAKRQTQLVFICFALRLPAINLRDVRFLARLN